MDFGPKLTNQLGIKNYRSFDDDGILLANLSKVNLLIGKNNCGKSNILKFLKHLQEIQGAWGNFNGDRATIHKGATKGSSIFLKLTHQELGLPEVYKDLVNGQLRDRPLTYAIDELLQFEFTFTENKFSVSGLRDNNKKLGEQPIEYSEHQLFQSLQAHFKAGGQPAWHAVEYHFKNHFLSGLQKLASRIIYIPDFRQITKPTGDSKKTAFTSLITGENIITELNKMKNPGLGEEASLKKFRKIEETVKNLLDADELTIEIPSEVNMMILTINGNRLALESLGTGLHEIILLCSALIIHDDNIVCMEEPEIHLHPALQRKFIKFLYQTNHQYFIATHSSAFIDDNHPDQATFHIQYDGRKSSVVPVNSSAKLRTLVDDLGYKASDLVQSNGIIWVEGPSDRAYIKKWLPLFENAYEEGIHYSIMFYGGKLLSHLSFDDEIDDAFIKLLSINKNSLIVIDRDVIGPDINSTKLRISNEIGVDKCWITEGREIENYLSQRALNQWLQVKEMKPITEGIDPNTKIDSILQMANPEFCYSKRKALYAPQIAEYFEKDDLKRLDLEARLADLFRHIASWNA